MLSKGFDPNPFYLLFMQFVKAPFNFRLYIILISFMQSEKKIEEATNKRLSIINYEELYYAQKEKSAELERQLQLQKLKVKTLINKLTMGNKSKACCQCNPKNATQTEEELIDDLKDFSAKMSTIIKIPSSEIGNQDPFLIQKPSIIKSQSKNTNNRLSIIQNFAIFGIQEEAIKDSVKGNQLTDEFQGQILYSMNDQSNIQKNAARFVFPSGMAIKKSQGNKAKQKTIELMSFCYTNLKSFILNFQAPQNNQQAQQIYSKNQLLEYVNPQRRLYCTCIGINDYTWIEMDKQKFNISLQEIVPSNKSIQASNGEIQIKSEGGNGIASYQSQKDSTKSIDEVVQQPTTPLTIGITQRVFCLMSYFPFFTFFQDLLRNLINNVKMERLAIYKHNQENIALTIKETDSKFQLQRMKQLFNECFTEDIRLKRLKFNQSYEMKLITQQKISLLTDWSIAKTYFIDQWIFAILNMFTYDTFIDLMTLVLLEDRLVFVCQNSHILTYTIFLFANILTKPFAKQFPIVNIIPNQEQFLNAPFPVVYGMLKKRKSVEDKRYIEKYDNTYVFLSPEKVDIIARSQGKDILKRRPLKLAFLKEDFKELKRYRKKQTKLITKYQIQSSDYCILASIQEKEKAVEIIAKVNEYILDEVVKRLPSQIEIQNIKKKIDPAQVAKSQDQHSYLMKIIANNIKKSYKDPFLQKILETQMINSYLFVK